MIGFHCLAPLFDSFFNEHFSTQQTANGGLVDLCIAGVCVFNFFFELVFRTCSYNFAVHRRHVYNKAASNESVMFVLFLICIMLCPSLERIYTIHAQKHTLRKPINLYHCSTKQNKTHTRMNCRCRMIWMTISEQQFFSKDENQQIKVLNRIHIVKHRYRRRWRKINKVH